MSLSFIESRREKKRREEKKKDASPSGDGEEEEGAKEKFTKTINTRIKEKENEEKWRASEHLQ